MAEIESSPSGKPEQMPQVSVLLRILDQQLGARLGPEQFDADLTQMGVDSLMALEIAQQLEEAFEIVIDDREALSFRTVNDISSSLMRAIAQRRSESDM